MFSWFEILLFLVFDVLMNSEICVFTHEELCSMAAVVPTALPRGAKVCNRVQLSVTLHWVLWGKNKIVLEPFTLLKSYIPLDSPFSC